MDFNLISIVLPMRRGSWTPQKRKLLLFLELERLLFFTGNVHCIYNSMAKPFAKRQSRTYINHGVSTSPTPNTEFQVTAYELHPRFQIFLSKKCAYS